MNEDERRKRLKVWISDEERILLESKAEYYGYKSLSAYIRDSAIYENVTYVDVKNKAELYLAYAENTKEVNKIAKELRHISRYATQLSKEDIKSITNIMFALIRNQKEMIKLINEKLDLEVWKEINYTKDIQDGEEQQCQLQKEKHT